MNTLHTDGSLRVLLIAGYALPGGWPARSKCAYSEKHIDMVDAVLRQEGDSIRVRAARLSRIWLTMNTLIVWFARTFQNTLIHLDRHTKRVSRDDPQMIQKVIALCFWGGLTQLPQEGPTGPLINPQ